MTARGGCIGGVVLAAGSSSRMGRNKLLLELEGEAVVRRAARQALEAGLSPVIVVLGFEAERVARALEGLPVEPVIDPRSAKGMHASLVAGLERLPADCDAAVVILADMPLVTSEMLAAVAARYRTGEAPLVISLYGEAQAPPTLYHRSLFPTLLAAGGGRDVVRTHRHLAAALHWPPELLADLDRPEDVARLELRIRRPGP